MRVARRVAEADLAVTVGVVEPHLYAGFSGGVKGVAIGCAGHETIAWTHRPAFVSAPGVAVGRLAGNPFHDTLVEIAARTPLAWAVNVVMNERGEAAAVAAGDPTAAQAALAQSARRRLAARRRRALRRGRRRRARAQEPQPLPGQPRGHLHRPRRRPALADGGLLVLCADLPGGAGDGPGERNFAEVLAAAASPAELVARGLREPLGPGGQRAFVVARVLERFRLAVVGAADARLAWSRSEWPRSTPSTRPSPRPRRASAARARVLAVADAMATVVSSRLTDVLPPPGRLTAA